MKIKLLVSIFFIMFFFISCLPVKLYANSNNINYQVHVKDDGWLGNVKSSNVARNYRSK